MRYRECFVKVGDNRHEFLVEHNDFVCDFEVDSIASYCALYDELARDGSDFDELVCSDISVTYGDDMGDDEFASLVLDGKHVRLVDSLVMFADRFDVVCNVYKVDLKHDLSDEEVYMKFAADCGQEADVDCIDIIGPNRPREEVVDRAWKDCLYQLKRYFQVSGIEIKRGVFHMTRLSLSDYEQMRQEREALAVA